MQFCPKCERAMAEDTSLGYVVFRCHCGEEVRGTPSDARVGGATQEDRETVELYATLLANAAHDRVNQQVARECLECGLDYMTLVRLGENEVVLFVCKCGARVLGADAKDASAPGADPGGPGPAPAPAPTPAAPAPSPEPEAAPEAAPEDAPEDGDEA
jgi:DNA-directed RNA polymerase subunit M/transcription elongation factor TFIIS